MKQSSSFMLRGISVSAMLLLLNQGCATRGIARPGEAEPVDQEAARVEASQAKPYLNVKIAMTNAGARTFEPVSRRIHGEVKGALLKEGFLFAPTPADVEVTLATEVTEFDKTGNYYVYEGTVNGTVVRTHDGKDVAATSFAEKGKRQLGEAKALDDLGDKLAAKIAPWASAAATSVQVDLAATDVTLKLPWLKRKRIHEYARQFVDEVSALHGVVACHLISQNDADRTLLMRIVYYRKEFPGGFMNTLKSIPSLKIK